jgi:hypothetical protein
MILDSTNSDHKVIYADLTVCRTIYESPKTGSVKSPFCLNTAGLRYFKNINRLLENKGVAYATPCRCLATVTSLSVMFSLQYAVDAATNASYVDQ